MNDPRTRTEEVELLRRRLLESGLSSSRFAIERLIRQPRTVRRWLSGESPIPAVVLEWLQDPPAAAGPPPASVGELRDRMQHTGVCDVCGAPDLNRGG